MVARRSPIPAGDHKGLPASTQPPSPLRTVMGLFFVGENSPNVLHSIDEHLRDEVPLTKGETKFIVKLQRTTYTPTLKNINARRAALLSSALWQGSLRYILGMKYFFWIAFAVFLAASIPHVAYFFASFEPSQGTEGVWWWVVSYAIAVSIDVTVYLLSWTAFQRYRRYRTPKAVWQHWLLIVMCTVFSWAVNWAYAKQFHSPVMLSSAETTAPWLTSVFPFMASAFPLLGIVYTMMAETVAEAEAEEQRSRTEQITALTELARRTQLPIATLRHLLQSGSRFKPTTLLAEINRSQDGAASLDSTKAEAEVNDARTITGQVLAVSNATTNEVQNTNPNQVVLPKDGGSDKLQMTVEMLKLNPDITDEVLAEYLSLKRPASARFWRLKAVEMLNASGKEQTTGQTTAAGNEWLVSNSMANGANGNKP